MQLELKRIGRTPAESQLQSVTIESYRTLCEAPNLLLIENDLMLINDDKESYHHRKIFKPVFLASCKTIFSNELLVLFYYGDFCELKGYVIGGLLGSFENSEQMYVLDYKSYCDICDITNETKMSVIKYFELLCGFDNEVLDFNTVLSYNGQELNCDKQKEFQA